MAPFDPDRLARRARRAYEVARLRQSLRFAVPFTLALGFAVLHVGSWRALALAIVALAVIVAGRAWGRAIGRGVRTGALAGLVPLLCPVLVNSFGHQCAGCAPATPLPLCLAACALSGALAAIWSGTRTASGPPSAELGAALTTAALLGAVGCAIAGGFGLLGMGIGIVLGGVPAVVVRAIR